MSKISKRDIVERFVDSPDVNKRAFWKKEMTLLNLLIEKYNLEFVNSLKFSKKFESIAIFLSGPLSEEIKSRWIQFNYKPRISSPEKVDISAEKSGPDAIISRKKRTIKDFMYD